MKNKLLKLSLSVPVALALFYAPNVFASTALIFDQSQPNNGTTCNVGNCHGTGYGIDAVSIGIFKINLSGGNQTASTYAEIYDAGNNLIASSTPISITAASPQSIRVFTLRETPTIDVSQLYSWKIVADQSIGNNPNYYASSSYPRLETPDILPPRLTIKYPINATTITKDFTDFQIYINNPNSAQNISFQPNIVYSRHSDFTGALTMPYPFGPNIQGPNSTSTFSLVKTSALYSNSVYYAYAYDSFTGATSSVVSWTTGQLIGTDQTNLPNHTDIRFFATSSSFGYVSVEATSSPFYVDCSAYENVPFFASGTIAGIWCNAKKTGLSVAEWLLVPPDFASTYWSNSLDSVKQVPPFSIVRQVVDSFNASAGLVATTTPDYSELNLTLPGGHITNQPILSADMLKNWLTTADCNSACAQTKKDTFFSYFSAIVWLGAGLKILTFIF